MTLARKTSAVGMLGRTWRQYQTAACGAAVIFVVASGFAVGFGAVVDRVITPDPTARASVAGPREIKPLQSAPPEPAPPPWFPNVDRPHDAPEALTDSSLADVFDGWYYDAPAITPVTTTRRPEQGLRNDSAPNELRIFGK